MQDRLCIRTGLARQRDTEANPTAAWGQAAHVEDVKNGTTDEELPRRTQAADRDANGNSLSLIIVLH